MSETTPTAPSISDGGFWRLSHDDLAAALARRDLNGETLRVYLALADLTRGYGKDRDTVSLSQIAKRAGMSATDSDGTKRPDCPHVLRALRRLAAAGLYGQAEAQGQKVTRWVMWPAPGPSATAGVGTTAKAGSGTTADVGNGTTAGATARAGKHQDTKTRKKSKKGVPPRPNDTGKSNGACGRMVALWVSSYARRVARSFPVSGRGRLAGTLKAMLQDASEEELAAFVERWFAAGRRDYGVALFKHKVEGGHAELIGRGRGCVEEDPIALYNGRKLAAEMAEIGA